MTTYMVTLTFKLDSAMLEEEDDNPGAVKDWATDDPVTFAELFENEMAGVEVTTVTTPGNPTAKDD